MIERGEGVHVFDDSGKGYIEGMAGLWCTSLGFGEERLVEAAARQMRKLPYYHAFAHKAHDPGIELAEELIEMAPVPMSKVFFTNSGSEANDTASSWSGTTTTRSGRPNKKKIIARAEGLSRRHRRGGQPDRPAASCTAISTCRSPASCTPTARTYYRYGEPGESEEEFATRLADRARGADPGRGAGHRRRLHRRAGHGRRRRDRSAGHLFRQDPGGAEASYDMLFIADEVICGFGRTGKMFGLQTYGLQPDIITVAKALSSAYLPIAAVMISEAIYQAMVRAVGQDRHLRPRLHLFRPSGLPRRWRWKTLKIYEERDIVGHVRAVAPQLQDGLRRFNDHPLVGEVRGVGLIAGVEIVADKAAKAPFDPKLGIGGHVARFAQEHGLIVRAMGDSIGFSPPLIITSAELDDLVTRFGKALDDTVGFVTERGLAAVA